MSWRRPRSFVLGLENTREKKILFAECMDTLTLNKALQLTQRVGYARLALQSNQAAALGAPVYAVRPFARNVNNKWCILRGVWL